MAGHKGIRTGKCFEGDDPILIWHISVAGEKGQTKAFLVVDGTQQNFGTRVETSRTHSLKTNGSVVAIIRKYAGSCSIGRILQSPPIKEATTKDPQTNDIWIELHKSLSIAPSWWIQLAWGSPPEIRFIAADNTSLVRKSSQGTYTKKRTNNGVLPPWPESGDWLDLSNKILTLSGDTVQSTSTESVSAESVSAESVSAESVSAESVSAEQTPKAAQDATNLLLSEYQRDSRDRLARRLKTIRKSLEKLISEDISAESTLKLKRVAHALKNHFHLLATIAPNSKTLTCEDDQGELIITLDPDKSPSQNLALAFERVRKKARKNQILIEEIANLSEDKKSMEDALLRLRTSPMSPAEIDALLAPFKLPAKQKHLEKVNKSSEQEPYKVYKTPGEKSCLIHVGKTAQGSDMLVKQAKGHDLWVHVVGTTGSHVIIPARQKNLNKESLLGHANDPLIRTAAILALHHSKMRDNLQGEVYFSRRQHLRKRKGMPPGLWQIDKAETIFVRYESADVKTILDWLQP